MKILLQHARTQLYFRGLGDWTANSHDAFDFQHSQKAIDFARDHGVLPVPAPRTVEAASHSMNIAQALERPFPWAPLIATAVFVGLTIWALKTRRKR